MNTHKSFARRQQGLGLISFIGLLVAVLLLVIAVRTVLFTPEPLSAEKFSPVVVPNEAAALERLSRAIQLRTISTGVDAPVAAGPLDDLIRFLASRFSLTFNSLKVQRISDYSLLLEWEGTNPQLKPMLLLGHTDVVPIANPDAWSVDPFAGEIKDGKIWGRGTLDDKSSVMAQFEAIEQMLMDGKQPERTVFFAFGHDEEIGGANGAVKIAEIFAERQLNFALILDEGGLVVDDAIKGAKQPLAFIGAAEKGYVTLGLTVNGVGGHSSMPPASTVIGQLSAALVKLENNPFPAALQPPASDMFAAIGPELPIGQRILFANAWLTEPLILAALGAKKTTNSMIRTTTAITVIHAGHKDNVLPAQATAMVNFRILPGESIQSVIDYVRKVIDDPAVEVQQTEFGNDPGPVSPIDGDGYQWLKRMVSASLKGDVRVVPNLVSGATDARHFVQFSDQVFRFLPFRVHNADLSGFHGVDEHISTDSYIEAIGFYYNLIEHNAEF